MRTCSATWFASQPAVGAIPPLVSVRRMKAASPRTPCPSWALARNRSHSMAPLSGASAFRNNLADDRGTIGYPPGRTGEVSADLPPLLVEEICLRRLERPLEEAAFSFAGIDLDAVCHDLEQRRGTLRGRHPGLVSIDEKAAHADQNSHPHSKSHNGRDAPEAPHKLKQPVAL